MRRADLPALPLHLLPGGMPPFGEEPGILVVEATRGLAPEVLGGLAPMLLGGGRRLFCADGANSFDPYVFSIQARSRGMNAAEVLRRIFLTRAFTIHQLEAVAEQMLPPLAREPDRPVVAILGLEHLFLEESLPLGERRQLLGRVLEMLAALRTEGMSLLLTHAPPERGRDWWQPMIARVGDARLRVLPEGRSTGAAAGRLPNRGSPIGRHG